MTEKTCKKSLPACQPGRNYHLMFWTIEVDPLSPAAIEKQKVQKVFKEIRAPGQVYVAKEISETGYHHIHVVNYWEKVRKWEPIAKRLVKAMDYNKSNGKKVSVRAFHPRHGGTEDYGDLKSYLTDSKHKIKSIDENGVEFQVKSNGYTCWYNSFLCNCKFAPPGERWACG